MKKKIILGLATTAVAIIPAVSVVACGSDDYKMDTSEFVKMSQDVSNMMQSLVTSGAPQMPQAITVGTGITANDIIGHNPVVAKCEDVVYKETTTAITEAQVLAPNTIEAIVQANLTSKIATEKSYSLFANLLKGELTDQQANIVQTAYYYSWMGTSSDMSNISNLPAKDAWNIKFFYTFLKSQVDIQLMPSDKINWDMFA